MVKARPRTIRFVFSDFAVIVVLPPGKLGSVGTDSRSVILTEPGSVDKENRLRYGFITFAHFVDHPSVVQILGRTTEPHSTGRVR